MPCDSPKYNIKYPLCVKYSLALLTDGIKKPSNQSFSLLYLTTEFVLALEYISKSKNGGLENTKSNFVSGNLAVSNPSCIKIYLSFIKFCFVLCDITVESYTSYVSVLIIS